MSAALLEHRGVTVEIFRRFVSQVLNPEDAGWYVTHSEVGTAKLGTFVNESTRDEAARLWVEQMQREGKL